MKRFLITRLGVVSCVVLPGLTALSGTALAESVVVSTMHQGLSLVPALAYAISGTLLLLGGLVGGLTLLEHVEVLSRMELQAHLTHLRRYGVQGRHGMTRLHLRYRDASVAARDVYTTLLQDGSGTESPFTLLDMAKSLA